MVGDSAARQLVARHGPTQTQDVADWSGDFALPPAVAHYYRAVGPVDVNIRGYGNDYFLPSLAGLWDLQEGYRWHANTRERLSEWSDEWLVVAYEGGDPFIFERTTERIMVAAHGTGAWDPGEVFSSINEMAAVLATLGSVIESAGDNFTDDESYIRPEHRRTAVVALARLLGGEAEANDALGLLGWG